MLEAPRIFIGVDVFPQEHQVDPAQESKPKKEWMVWNFGTLALTDNGTKKEIKNVEVEQTKFDETIGKTVASTTMYCVLVVESRR